MQRHDTGTASQGRIEGPTPHRVTQRVPVGTIEIQHDRGRAGAVGLPIEQAQHRPATKPAASHACDSGPGQNFISYLAENKRPRPAT